MCDLTTDNEFFKKVIYSINSTRYETFKVLNKFNIEKNDERKYYLAATDKSAWSRSVLLKTSQSECIQTKFSRPETKQF